MARFDVYRLAKGGLVVDCQANILSNLTTRLVVPLIAKDDGPRPIARLNPIVEFDGSAHAFYADLAAAIPVRDLKRKVGTLADDEYRILAALDMLIVGY